MSTFRPHRAKTLGGDRQAGFRKFVSFTRLREAVKGILTSQTYRQHPLMTLPHPLILEQSLSTRHDVLEPRRLRHHNISPARLSDKQTPPAGSTHNGRSKAAARDRQGPVAPRTRCCGSGADISHRSSKRPTKASNSSRAYTTSSRHRKMRHKRRSWRTR